MEQHILKKCEMLFGKNFCKDLLEFGEVTASVKREDGLGIEFRNSFIVSMTYTCQFIGQLKIGDCLIAVNGVFTQDPRVFVKNIQVLIKKQSLTPMTIKFMRLKRKIPRPPTFPPIHPQEGYSYETSIIYNMKGILHLGLDLRDIEGKLMVTNITENSIADITFSLGEAIIDIDGEKVSSVVVFQERLKKSLEIRNYALVCVEIPTTDLLKNAIRNKIAASLKDTNKVNPIPGDVKIYCAEGIAVLRKMIEPKPIFQCEKQEKSGAGASKPSPIQLRLDERVKEQDIPSSWNSRLFVKLPPAKTLESENAN
ncbi:unnamed protein product [Caenorhabditis angaria]|uniref:PDZ domain-containing protein n=1 Tax=Caenorhabditis angaria TaxID=860376 RepID=A0A9P1IZQ2_9PELO|nr:unnamed protein product [Caenorhabditis angaria]